MVTRQHLEAFLDVVEHGSLKAAAEATGRSRASYHRWLAELEAALDAPPLLRRAPGQREVELTHAGQLLAERARVALARWEHFVATTRDALARAERSVRVGALAGSFDLIADLVLELRREAPELLLSLVELPPEELVPAVAAGQVDLAFGTAAPDGAPGSVTFTPFGPLPWAVIAPAGARLPDEVRLADLDEVPLVLPRAGPLRARIERHFASAPGGPLTLAPAVEVESTPRLVEMVARGFGAAVVSRFRLAFLPPGVMARPLVDGPEPLLAGAFTRAGAPLADTAETLLARARARFHALTALPFPGA